MKMGNWAVISWVVTYRRSKIYLPQWEIYTSNTGHPEDVSASGRVRKFHFLKTWGLQWDFVNPIRYMEALEFSKNCRTAADLDSKFTNVGFYNLQQSVPE